MRPLLALSRAFFDASALFAAALLAYMMHFDFAAPRWGWFATLQSCAIAAIVQTAVLSAFGCHSHAWRRFGWRDVPRLAAALAAACGAVALMRLALPSESFANVRQPYSIAVISLFTGAAALFSMRIAWRGYVSAAAASRPLPIERAERSFDNTVAARFLAGRTVLVTGAGGSIGSEIVRQCAAAGARRIVMVERCENALYEIDRSMRKMHAAAETVPVMLDAGDRDSMDALFEKEKPSVVVHAAACKHVPMVELNPEEGWRNNVEATKTLAALAAKHGVLRFVLISTDKAVNPVSAMGRSKRAAEEAVMAMPPSATSFCAVRFGNVYGSSGSVVPLFAEQIAAGGPVTVTHPDMRRYFMTVQEAVSLVLQAASRSEKAIYTLDMGESVRIVSLAEHMIERAGLRPYIDIPIIFTGVRPGEKLFEEIDVSEKSAYKTDMAKIYINRA